MTELGRLALFCLARARESDDFLAELGRWRDILARPPPPRTAWRHWRRW